MDLDAFFASVEQLDHPEWRGRPVIVGGDPSGRGVVSTASYEARVFGVGSAMPSARAAALCPDAVWAPPRFDRYRELSGAVMSILEKHSPVMQQVSIDEAYLDVTPGAHTGDDPVRIAEAIRSEIARLGLTASIGIGTSKTVAKIASDMQKPDGLTVVTPGSEATFLAPLPVRKLPGIGPRSAERLNDLGIRTLGELAALDERTARELLGSFGPVAVERAAGSDSRPVGSDRGARSLSAERTFAADLHTSADVEQAVRTLATQVASRVERRALMARTLTLKIRFTDFTTRTAGRTEERPMSPERITELAIELLSESWTPGVGVRLLGIAASGFRDSAEQLDLFAESAPERDTTRVQGSLEAIRERFGRDAISRGWKQRPKGDSGR